MPKIGKIPPELLQRTILRKLGAHRSELLQGPMLGVDNAVIRVAPGTVAVCTTDPISIIPALGAYASAWLSVHLLASDVTTSGFQPAFAIFDLNLPPKMEDHELESYWVGIHRACEGLGVAIIGGHTGRFVGCDYTIMGGGVMIALGPEEKYLTSRMARAGDILLLTKGAAVSTTGILAHVFPNRIEREFGHTFLRQAQGFLNKSSTVKDALTAVSVGVSNEGVTAMHDVTEGGVLGGIVELVSASGKGARIRQNSIHVAEETQQTCKLFNIDPLTSLSEGSLVISVRSEKRQNVQAALERVGIPSFLVGEVLEPESGVVLESDQGKKGLTRVERDPYWDAYWKAIDEGWT